VSVHWGDYEATDRTTREDNKSHCGSE